MTAGSCTHCDLFKADLEGWVCGACRGVACRRILSLGDDALRRHQRRGDAGVLAGAVGRERPAGPESVAFGAHWPSDVPAGLLLSGAGIALLA